MQEMLRTMCGERGAEMRVVDAKYAGDCGAMIAWAGALAYKSGRTVPLKDSGILPKWRTDEADIAWMR
jgi:tRNA A37 threonylcarbamoyltransferase TsaD